MYYYETGPIDYFAGTVALEVFKEQIQNEVDSFNNADDIFSNVLRNLDIAKTIFREHSCWEGDIVAGPFIFAIPDPDNVEMRYGFVWKQENNGATYITSPLELVWIEEYKVWKD